LVFHLAALVDAQRSHQDPLGFFEINGKGVACVMEACRRAGVQKIVYTSTSHVYGIPREVPNTEDHPTVPLSVYAASKLAGEAAVVGFAASFGIDSVIARLSNIFGGYSSPNTVVGRAVEQAASGKPIELRNLSPVRDFIHVSEVVEALVRLSAIDLISETRTVNVSSGNGVSVGEMATVVAEIAFEEGLERPQVLETDTETQDPIPAMVLDHRRLEQITGWTPSMSLKEGLRLAFKEHIEGATRTS